jgi:hypothetical protein
VAVLPAGELVVAEAVMVTAVSMLTTPCDDDTATLTMSANEAITDADVMTVVTVLDVDVGPGDEDTAHTAVLGMAIATMHGNNDAVTLTMSTEEDITEDDVVPGNGTHKAAEAMSTMPGDGTHTIASAILIMPGDRTHMARWPRQQ